MYNLNSGIYLEVQFCAWIYHTRSEL